MGIWHDLTVLTIYGSTGFTSNIGGFQGFTMDFSGSLQSPLMRDASATRRKFQLTAPEKNLKTRSLAHDFHESTELGLPFLAWLIYSSPWQSETPWFNDVFPMVRFGASAISIHQSSTIVHLCPPHSFLTVFKYEKEMTTMITMSLLCNISPSIICPSTVSTFGPSCGNFSSIKGWTNNDRVQRWIHVPSGNLT